MICIDCVIAADTRMPHIGCIIGCTCQHRGVCGDRHECSASNVLCAERAGAVFYCNRPAPHPDLVHLFADIPYHATHTWGTT